MVPSIGAGTAKDVADGAWAFTRALLDGPVNALFRDSYLGYALLMFLALGATLAVWRLIMRRV